MSLRSSLAACFSCSLILRFIYFGVSSSSLDFNLSSRSVQRNSSSISGSKVTKAFGFCNASCKYSSRGRLIETPIFAASSESSTICGCIPLFKNETSFFATFGFSSAINLASKTRAGLKLHGLSCLVIARSALTRREMSF